MRSPIQRQRRNFFHTTALMVMGVAGLIRPDAVLAQETADSVAIEHLVWHETLSAARMELAELAVRNQCRERVRLVVLTWPRLPVRETDVVSQILELGPGESATVRLALPLPSDPLGRRHMQLALLGRGRCADPRIGAILASIAVHDADGHTSEIITGPGTHPTSDRILDDDALQPDRLRRADAFAFSGRDEVLEISASNGCRVAVIVAVRGFDVSSGSAFRREITLRPHQTDAVHVRTDPGFVLLDAGAFPADPEDASLCGPGRVKVAATAVGSDGDTRARVRLE